MISLLIEVRHNKLYVNDLFLYRPQLENLEILDFHTFFVGLPIEWIELASSKCKQRVEKAISLDEVRVRVQMLLYC